MTGESRTDGPVLTAVVLNWNQPELTIQAVQALLADGVPTARTVVVDNGSTDGSWERLLEAVPGCILVRIEENVGFARGNNIGAGVLPGDAYLFVNSDAFVHRPGSVAALLRALDRPDIGVVVPRLVKPGGALDRTVVPTPGPMVALLRMTGLSRLVPNGSQPEWGFSWDHASSRAIRAAFGAVMLVRASLWSELGGFREGSFMYAEDLDLCWSARERGATVWFAAEAEFLHVGSASTTWDDRARGERIGAANAAMIRAHLSPLRAATTLAVFRGGLAVWAACRTLRGDRAAAARWNALRRGFGARAAAELVGPRPELVVVRPPLGDTAGDEARPLRT